jgi:hypothetical protein
LGVAQTVLQSDGDPGIMSLMKKVANLLNASGVKASCRKTPARDPQSNGAAESAVCSIKKMVATLVSVINVNYEMRLSPRHWLFAWLVRHAAWSISRFTPKGPSKHSAYFAVHGHNYSGMLIPYGECVNAKIVRRKKSGSKHMTLWKKGVFVGKEEHSDAWLVATDEGVEACRTVRRLTEDSQYDRSVLLACGGVP